MKKLLQLLGIINKKARTNSYIIDKDGNHWLYLRKVKNGYLFRNNLGRIKTLESTRIFKGYKF